MHVGFDKLDPKWLEFAASLRKGQLYVKMPVTRARALSLVWDILRQKEAEVEHVAPVDDILKMILQEAKDSQTYGVKSVFYMLSTDQCEKDIEALNNIVGGDKTGVFKRFKETLEKGLRSEPEVDWISRVGGPKAHTFEALQTESEPVDPLIEDLFVDQASLSEV